MPAVCECLETLARNSLLFKLAEWVTNSYIGNFTDPALLIEHPSKSCVRLMPKLRQSCLST